MFYLYSLLRLIIDNNIDYDDCLLPGKDASPQKSSCWIWELYSDAQKANRISKFFYFHQLSYLEMVETNFPMLCHKFSRYADAPYQNIVFVYLKEDREQKDMYSEPSLTFYYIASPTDYPIPPQLQYLSNEDKHSDYSKEIYNEIRQSYLKQGKEVNRLGYTRTGFTVTTTSTNPLSNYVYTSIKSSLEEIFGRF